MYFEFYKLQSWGKRSVSRRRRFNQRFLKQMDDVVFTLTRPYTDFAMIP